LAHSFQVLWHDVLITTESPEASRVVAQFAQRADQDLPREARVVLDITSVGSEQFRVLDGGDLVATVKGPAALLEVLFARVFGRAFELAGLKGWLTVQGSLVRLGSRRVAVIGPPGSGKTTMALALLLDSGEVEGDEFFLARNGTVVAAPRRFNVKPGTFDIVPRARVLLPGPTIGSIRAVDPTEHGFSWRLPVGPIDGMVLLRRTEAASCLEPVPAARAAQTVVEQARPMMETRAALVREASALVASVPTYSLQSGPDLRAVELLRDVPGDAAQQIRT
jgi:hypothetical protein